MIVQLPLWQIILIIVSALSIGSCLGLVCASLLAAAAREPVEDLGAHTNVLPSV